MQAGQFGLLCRSGLSLTVTRRCRLGIRDKYEPEYRQIVDALVTERKARGLTQGQVAQAMGVEQSRVSKYAQVRARGCLSGLRKLEEGGGSRRGPAELGAAVQSTGHHTNPPQANAVAWVGMWVENKNRHQSGGLSR